MALTYELTPDLVTGNALIDSEHRQLLATVNNLMDACSQGHGREKSLEVFEYLLGYVKKHFADDARLQTHTKYPNYPEHKQFHDRYKKELEARAQVLRAEGPTVKTLGVLNQQVGVLVSHIRMEDKKLAKHVREHG